MDHLSVSQKIKIVKAVAGCVFLVFIIAVAGVCVVVTRAKINSTRPYIQDLYVPSLVVPALNKTTAFNASVFVDLKFEREAALTRRGYRDFQMTLSYGQRRSMSFPVGAHKVQGFSMGRQKRVDVKLAVQAAGMPWEEAFRAVSGGKVVAMVVELMMSDETSWVAHVAVDASGHMVSKKPIEFEEWHSERI